MKRKCKPDSCRRLRHTHGVSGYGLSVCSFKEIRKINNASIMWHKTCYEYEVDCRTCITAFANTALAKTFRAVNIGFLNGKQHIVNTGCKLFLLYVTLHVGSFPSCRSSSTELLTLVPTSFLLTETLLIRGTVVSKLAFRKPAVTVI